MPNPSQPIIDKVADYARRAAALFNIMLTDERGVDQCYMNQIWRLVLEYKEMSEGKGTP